MSFVDCFFYQPVRIAMGYWITASFAVAAPAVVLLLLSLRKPER